MGYIYKKSVKKNQGAVVKDIKQWRFFQEYLEDSEGWSLLIDRSLMGIAIKKFNIKKLLIANYRDSDGPIPVIDFNFRRETQVCSKCNGRGFNDWVSNIVKPEIEPTPRYAIIEKGEYKLFSSENIESVFKIKATLVGRETPIEFYVPKVILKENEQFICKDCVGSGLNLRAVHFIKAEEISVDDIIRKKE